MKKKITKMNLRTCVNKPEELKYYLSEKGKEP